MGGQEDISKDGTDCERHTLGDKQGFDRHEYREFKHLGFAETEVETPPFLEQDQKSSSGVPS